MSNAVEETSSYFILYSNQNKPLKLWDKKIRAGYICQLIDQDLRCCVLEIISMKSSRTYITCPADPKNVLDVLTKDNKNVRRRFRALTKQKETQLKPYVCRMPHTLEEGWNDIVMPLNEFIWKAFGSVYVETLRVQIHASCRVQKVFFSYRRHVEGDFLKEVVVFS